jgi:hypothetical protein
LSGWLVLSCLILLEAFLSFEFLVLLKLVDQFYLHKMLPQLKFIQIRTQNVQIKEELLK